MPLGLNTQMDALEPSGIRRFSALAQKTPGCINLTLGEPGEDTPPQVGACVTRSLAAGMTHYPPNNGWPRLREALSSHMGAAGLEYAPDEIIVTSGATEALFCTLATLLNPGDEVVIPRPCFSLYASVATLCRARPVFLDTGENSFQIDGAALSRLVGGKTKAVVLTSPNNPTGCVLDAGSLDAVASLAARHDFYVVCDDVYDQLVYDDGFEGFAHRHPGLRDRTVVVNSFSKPYAMTGWRLGWLAAPEALAGQIAKVHQFAVSSVPSFTQDAAVCALSIDVDGMRESYRARRDLVLERLSRMGLPVVRPQGAFYAFPSVAGLGLSSAEFCVRAIKEAGVALVPGSVFGAEGHVRLSYATDEGTLVRGLDRLELFVQGLR